MRHIDLFTGISGFPLAASWVWGEEYKPVFFCEIDPFCRMVLKKLWPNVPCIKDVNDEEQIAAHVESIGLRQGRPESKRQCGKSSVAYGDCEQPDSDVASQLHDGSGQARRGRCQHPNGSPRIDLLTGGPPCQPSSCAGLRAGTKDPRWLWPQALKAVEITKPRWIIFENPTGFLTIDGGLAYESVCADLEGKGYWIEGFVIPASAVGAWHRRDRIWIIAHDESERCSGECLPIRPGEPRQTETDINGCASQDSCRCGLGTGSDAECGQASRPTQPCDSVGIVANHNESRSPSERTEGQGGTTNTSAACPPDRESYSDAHGSLRDRRPDEPKRGEEGRIAAPGDNQNDPDPHIQGPQIREMQFRNLRQECATAIGNYWDMHWLQAVTQFCGVAHGLPVGLDGTGGIPTKPKKKSAAGRQHRIKALGNAVVPELVFKIMLAIKEAIAE